MYPGNHHTLMKESDDERDHLELHTYHPLFRVIKTLDELNGGALPSSA